MANKGVFRTIFSLTALFVSLLVLTSIIALLAGLKLPKTSSDAHKHVLKATLPVDDVQEDNQAGEYVLGDERHDLSCFSKEELKLNNGGIDLFNLPCGKKATRAAAPEDRYTIVCNTFRRPKLLRKSIEHYTKCPNIDKFIVVWSDVENEPYDWLSDAKNALRTNDIPVTVERFNRNVLTNQFKLHEEINTQAVLNIDDDVLVQCPDVEFAFQTWRLHKQRMIGFFPRALSCKNFEGNLDYHSGNPNRHATDIGYRLVLTKAAFYDKKFHQKFWESVPKKFLSHVENTMNCEDLAFSFAHANITGLAPIWVRTIEKIRDVIVKSAISKKRGHATARDNCIDMLRQSYGRLPPVTTIHLTRCSDKLPWDWAKRAVEQTPGAPSILSLYPPFPPKYNRQVQNYVDFVPNLPRPIRDRLPQLVPSFIAQLGTFESPGVPLVASVSIFFVVTLLALFL